jgi:alpha-tubulin suppressor-like RCC1 family protein
VGRLWKEETVHLSRLGSWLILASALLGMSACSLVAVPTPMAEPDVSLAPQPASAIVASFDYTCALMLDRTTRCWGRQGLGQLGDGTTTERHSPVAVKGLSNVAAIAAGGLATCALLDDGAVRCWGGNDSGQLGDGTYEPHPTPMPVTGIDAAIGVAAGFQHACALLADGTVRCWGNNIDGQLGDESDPPARTVPGAVPGISTAARLAAGENSTCAVLADGTIRCWGDQVRDPEIDHGRSRVPVPIPGISDAQDVSVGVGTTCVLLSGGTVQCWGGWTMDPRDPTGQSLMAGPSSPTPVPGISTAVAVAAGFNYACALLADGTVQCWGDNNSGALGVSDSIPRSMTPLTVEGITRAVAVSAGRYHACAILSDGSVRCWGSNWCGQFGTGQIDPSPVPPPPVKT